MKNAFIAFIAFIIVSNLLSPQKVLGAVYTQTTTGYTGLGDYTIEGQDPIPVYPAYDTLQVTNNSSRYPFYTLVVKNLATTTYTLASQITTLSRVNIFTRDGAYIDTIAGDGEYFKIVSISGNPYYFILASDPCSTSLSVCLGVSSAYAYTIFESNSSSENCGTITTPCYQVPEITYHDWLMIMAVILFCVSFIPISIFFAFFKRH